MKKFFFIIVLFVFTTGCNVSDDTIKLSEGIAAYNQKQEENIKKLLKDPAIKAKYPKLSAEILKDAAALTRASRGLWFLLEGRSKDEVVE